MLQFRRITTQKRFIPQIDGLRFVAISSVALLHLYAALETGIIPAPWTMSSDFPKRGVELFFAISGFILGIPFASHYVLKAAKVDLKQYFLRRLTRLEPPYFISLLVWAAVQMIAGHRHLGEMGPHLLSSFAYLHNAFFGAFPGAINLVAWSLEIEIQFYVLVPLLFDARFRFPQHRCASQHSPARVHPLLSGVFPGRVSGLRFVPHPPRVEALFSLGCSRTLRLAARVVFGREYRSHSPSISYCCALSCGVPWKDMLVHLQQSRHYKHWGDVLQHLSVPCAGHLCGKTRIDTVAHRAELLGLLRAPGHIDLAVRINLLWRILPDHRAPLYGQGMASQAVAIVARPRVVVGPACTAAARFTSSKIDTAPRCIRVGV